MRRLIAICLFLAGMLAGTAHAQTYSIPWYKIAGGGGSSSNGAFTVTGTIGQPDAGSMSGGQFSLTGGFWGIIAAVQTPGSPLLMIAKATGNQVAVSWPAPSTGFVLQANPNLVNTNGWNGVNTNSFPVVTSNGTNTVTLPVSGNEFFRLVAP